MQKFFYQQICVYVAIIIFLCHQSQSIAQTTNHKNSIIQRYSQSAQFGPMGDIFIIQYGRKLSNNLQLILGASYTNPAVLDVIVYPGTEQIFTLEMGLRSYLWQNLHLEIQLDPQYFQCWESTEKKNYNGFGLTPEIRFGYVFDFWLGKTPLTFTLQWFAGYHIINPKPPSFQKVDGGSLYISPFPMFFIGIKF